MKNLAPWLICLLPILAFSQNKLYFNKLYEEVDSTEAFDFYRIISKQPDGLTLVQEFSPADTLLFQGKYSRYQVKKEPDIRQGVHEYYRKDGSLYYTYNYVNNEMQGENRSYYPGGQLKRIEIFEKNNFIRGECFNEDGSKRAFTRLQQAPSFPGGEKELFKYLSGNLKYPSLARENFIQGQVLLTFVVDREGKVGDVRVVKDIGGGCGQEAVRLVQAMPDWVPGTMDDKPVKVRYTLPLTYKLEGRGKRKRKKD